MKCPKCRQPNASDSVFCGKCGYRFGGPESAPLTRTLETGADEFARGMLFAGRYEIIEKLGAGGMGLVYRAFDKELDEDVALKLIRPEIAVDPGAAGRFRNEIKTTRRITHKNVCRTYDLGEDGKRLFITMEYVRGEDLKGLIQRSGPLEAKTAVSIGRQIAAGLGEAHRLGVVHRDLKPANIMVDGDGNAKIMDFGIARSLAGTGRTAEGALIGTPDYMSPEQVEGGPAGPGSDIYALGVILYEMVAGRRPFDGETPLAVAHKQRYEPPLDPRRLVAGVPDGLARIILKCLAKDAASRYESAETLDTALAGLGEERPAGGKGFFSKSGTARRKTGFRRPALPVPALGAVFAAAAVLLLVLLLPPKKTKPAAGMTKIAVLPFENLGPAEDEYFADGITDEIIARLTGIGTLGVIARSSTMPYKKTAKSVKTIGEELGVEFLVSGTIRWQNTGPGTGRVRVTPSLVRVGDAMQIWARVYDESVAEIFQVQSDISKSLVDALGIALAGREERTLGGVLTSSLAAYDFYLRGVEISQSAGLGGEPIRRAIEMFEKAVAADPGFLRAYAELARLHANYYFLYYDHSPGRAAKARAAADRAFRINPQDLDVEKALAYYYYWCEQDYDQALKYFRLVLSKAPHHPGVSGGIGFVLRRQGRLEEAVGYLKTAAELNPRSCDAPFHVGQTCAFLRDYREAERWYDRALSLKNDFETVYDNKIRLFINQGRLADARRVAEEEARAVARPDPNKSLYHAILLGILEGKNRETLDRLAAGAPEAFSDQFYFMPKTLLAARIHAFAKNEAAASSSYEAALGVIERKIQENPEDSRCYGALGIALAGLGRKAEAVRAARRATEIMPISRDAVLGQFRAVELAQVYAMVGEFDQAFDLIERLLSLPGEMSVARIRTDRIWEPLRALPRFEALARKFRS